MPNAYVDVGNGQVHAHEQFYNVGQSSLTAMGMIIPGYVVEVLNG